MNDQKIYELMFKTPGIRAVQIADALDAELVDISNALKSLVEVGDVVQTKGFSPNGHQAMIYNLSDGFKRSRQYADLVASAAARAKTALLTPAPNDAPAAAASLAPVIDAIENVVTVGNVVLATRDGSALTAEVIAAVADAEKADAPEADGERRISPLKRTERALAFLRQCGPDGARAEDLCDAMGLRHDQSPSNFLRTARSRGQVTVKDHRWRYVEQPGFMPVSAARPAPSADGPFRCGIWLDDVIELQRGGTTIGTLARAEAVQLRDFLNRVLPCNARIGAAKENDDNQP
jgi:hypothetical protein